MLILASQSPRRHELLGLFHIPFCVRVPDVDETMDPHADPRQEVARVSRCKAEAVSCDPGDVVIAADTIVVLEGAVLGKPRDAAHAVQMLTALSGRTHQVMTGVTVLKDGKALTHTEVTEITFRPMEQKEIEAYVATGEPMDKAGSYGIQGGAALFAENMQGDYYNVMGLPVCALWKMLRALAPELMEENR